MFSEPIVNPTRPISWQRDGFRMYPVLSRTLGLLLMVAAVLKWNGVVVQPGPSGSDWLLKSLIAFEVLFGVWLVVGLAPTCTWHLCVLCFSMFATYSLYMAMRGAESCGCMGAAKISPWFTFVFDIGAAILLISFPPEKVSVGSRGRAGWRFAVFVLLTLTILAPLVANIDRATANAFGQPDIAASAADKVHWYLNPEAWIGEELPILSSIDVRKDIAVGEWVVLFHRADCLKCKAVRQRLIEAQADYSSRHGFDILQRRLALVELPPFSSPKSDIVRPPYVSGKLDDSRVWTARTPIVLYLSGGTVEAVLE